MRFLIMANVVASIALSIWSVLALRQWARSIRGRDTLRAWSPAIVIPAQGAVALLWLQMALALPWTNYILYKLAGSWWVIPGMFVVSFLLIIVPFGLIVVDAEWLRIHPMPSHWTLQRIWAATGATAISSGVLIGVSGNFAWSTGFAILLIFTVAAAIFLTAWWIVSRPLIRD